VLQLEDPLRMVERVATTTEGHWCIVRREIRGRSTTLPRATQGVDIAALIWPYRVSNAANQARYEENILMTMAAPLTTTAARIRR
jgi:hypothetical protein